MKKIIKNLTYLLISTFILTMTLSVSAKMVNPFYAIDSALEYNLIKENLGSDSHMYFQWGRLAINNDGFVQYTHKMSFGISSYDNRSEYGIPCKVGDKTIDEYIIKPGDSLYKISKEYQIPYSIIKDYNNILDPNTIMAGSSIKIPEVLNDLSSKESYVEKYPNGKALLSIYFDATEYSDKKNSGIEFLNMSEDSWDKYIIGPIIDTLDTMDFHGVVLDFEAFRDTYDNNYYSVEQRSGLKEKYNKFLTKLRNSLKDKTLAVIVHPSNVAGYYDGYHISEIEKISDYIILMAYDYQYIQKYSSQDNVPSQLYGKIKTIEASKTSQPYVQPLNKVEESVKYIIKDIKDPHKILLGISLVGMKWVKYKKTIEGKAYFYYELSRPDLKSIEEINVPEQYISGPSISKKIIPSDKLPDSWKKELSKPEDTIVEVEIHYESAKSLYSKYHAIVKNHNLSGITVWRVGKGSVKTWSELVNMFKDDYFLLTLTPGEKYMTVNGVNKEIDPGRDTVPLIIEGRTLVPIRSIIESAGGSIDWNAKENTVLINCKNSNIKMTIGSKTITVNGTDFDNDVAPQIINGRTYMPLRFLMENLGFDVDWDNVSKVITIKSFLYKSH